MAGENRTREDMAAYSSDGEMVVRPWVIGGIFLVIALILLVWAIIGYR